MTAAFPPAAEISRAAVRVLPTRPAEALRVGVLTPHNPHDRRAFSGTVFHAVEALSRQPGLAVSLIGPHRPAGRIERVLRRASQRFEPHMLAPDGSDFRGLDVVIGLVASPLLDEAAMLTDLPMLHVTDATPGFLSAVYGRDLSAAAARREARVLARATPVYSSRLMAARALAEFGAPAGRAHVLPFGVNFPGLRPEPVQKPPLDRLGLLFVGGDWDRKGGDLALEAFEELRAAGRDAHLTLVGGVPGEIRDAVRHRADITVAGFLDKNIPRQMARLSALFRRAHVFVLPTRADCTPMVVAEALAHGTPVLATDVGAIGEMVGPGAGRLLPLGATARDWAAELSRLTADPAAHAMMSDAASERTSTRLNWDSWAQGIALLALDAAAAGARAAA